MVPRRLTPPTTRVSNSLVPPIVDERISTEEKGRVGRLWRGTEEGLAGVEEGTTEGRGRVGYLGRGRGSGLQGIEVGTAERRRGRVG
jgi:hypothetical protein